MTLAEEYRKQTGWRAWSSVWCFLPDIAGQTIIDAGCGIGEQAVELAERGANVVGIDLDEELLAVARQREIRGARFHVGDFRDLQEIGSDADGIWCGFGAAYVTSLTSMLKVWKKRLKSRGWIAVTEVDNLFGHEPISNEAKVYLDAYAQKALREKRYDFYMGSKLPEFIASAGFRIEHYTKIPDKELSFDGPATTDVLEAWGRRMQRMTLLRDFCGSAYPMVREEFLQTLMLKEHRSLASVYFCFARI